jgi:deoxyribose-phosphate aldolase
MTLDQLAQKIDHTLLKAEATPDQIDRLCGEALTFNVYAVCVNPDYVRQAVDRLKNSKINVAAVVGFPLGASRTATKVEEARRAIDDGALEIDMVAPIGRLIAGDRAAVRDDLDAVADAVHAASSRHQIKVILETAALTPEQIILGCRCAAEAQVDFVKTSTGFHPAGGATVEAVKLLHKTAAPIQVKAAGGIRDLPTALVMINAGAHRIGTSAAPAILQQLR